MEACLCLTGSTVYALKFFDVFSGVVCGSILNMDSRSASASSRVCRPRESDRSSQQVSSPPKKPLAQPVLM